jgi:hypothetical protein
MALKLMCLIPYHIAWGCTTSFWIYYVLGDIVTDQQGRKYVGIMSIIDFFTSLIFSFFGNQLTKRLSNNQTPMIAWGWMCMTGIGMFVILLSDNDLGTPRRLIGYACAHGMTRAVYENNVKVVIANFFPENQSIAYTVTSFSKTFTSGITFLYYSFIVTRRYYGVLVIMTSTIGLLGYITASHINRQEIAEGYVPMRTSESESGTSTQDTNSTSDNVVFVADFF